MGAVIPATILGLAGQVIKSVVFDEERAGGCGCDRDRRRRPMDCRTGRRGQVNRLLQRTVRDAPIGGWPCEVEIEYAETFLPPGHVRVEQLPFVCPKAFLPPCPQQSISDKTKNYFADRCALRR